MDSIEFNNFFCNLYFNYMINIYNRKIEHQPKNKNLFETMITLQKVNKNKLHSLFSNKSDIKI